MAQNKFENQIKEQLNSREIQPSAQAWDRLDAMLTVAEEKKTKRSPFLSFQFIGIAASVLVLVSLGMFFFTQNGKGIQRQNSVVETKVNNDTVKQEQNKIQAPIVEKNKENQAVASSSSISNHNQSISTNQSQSIINQKTNNNPSIHQNQINNEKPINLQSNQAVAQKETPKTEERKPSINTLSDEELLASLDNSARKSTSQKATLKVDAKSLLSQVDGEVEYTFREKVINKISKNYKEVKVALANRNKE